MPDATVSTEPVRRELKSAPPDGWVDLLPLPYYDMLERQDGAARLYAQASEDGETDNRMYMESMQQWSRAYEFRHCVVGHNLTDRDGKPLDFSKGETLRSLNPAIGNEIAKYIDELNGETDESPDFTKQQSSSSSEKSSLDHETGIKSELDKPTAETL